MPASTTTGAQTLWTFVWEDDDSFAQEPGEPADNDFKPFGDRENITEPDGNNNYESIFRPFSREPSNYLEGEFTGSWGVDFIYTNPYWLSFIFGAPDVVETDGVYNLTYELSPDNPPRSAHVIEETHYDDGSVEQNVYIGAIVESPSVSISVGDTVDVSLSGNYSSERNYADASLSPHGIIGEQPDTNFRPLHFGNANLFLDINEDGNAERQGRVQQIDFNFNGTVQLEQEIGTRFATVPSFLELEPDVSYSKFLSSDTKEQERRSFYGSLENEELEDFALPQETLCGSDIAGRVELSSKCETNEAKFMFAQSFSDTYQRTNSGDVQSAIEEDVDRNVLGVSVSTQSEEEPR